MFSFKKTGSDSYLIVFAISITTTVMWKNTALPVQDITWITLTTLHAVMIAITFKPDRSTSRLAHTNTALIMTVCWACEICKF